MNVTRDVIIDLLPLYYSEECSQATKLLVEEYLQKNPDFKQQAKQFAHDPFPKSIPQRLEKDDEMKALIKTRRVLRLRSYLMGFAIFFSCATFSFMYDQGKFHWLVLSSPKDAIIYGTLSICFWIAYLIFRLRTRDL
ncbi:MAG: hypothetical protein WAV76_07400 [Bacteroidota bacterium]